MGCRSIPGIFNGANQDLIVANRFRRYPADKSLDKQANLLKESGRPLTTATQYPTDLGLARTHCRRDLGLSNATLPANLVSPPHPRFDGYINHVLRLTQCINAYKQPFPIRFVA
jgi:hypothetical protein